MDRHYFQNQGRMLSYLDWGGDGEPLIALHSHWMEAQTFSPFAEALGLRWRVIALDQRGHGYSDHFPTYVRGDYLSDLSQLFARLGLRRSILMGNSLGGVNAYQFAARSPESVPALIVEDAGAVISLDTSFVLNWAGTFENRKDLEERIGPRFLPYLTDSIRQDPNGWRLAFDPPDMEASQSLVNGDHWSD
jgi:esterase